MKVIKLMTYNILFDSKYLEKRTNTIINIILSESPDIVALQEVTPSSYNIIVTNPDITKIYHINKIRFREPYGTLLLSKYPIEHASYIQMSITQMGRRLEYITVNIDDTKATIATVHWESQFPTYRDKTEKTIKKKMAIKISQYIESFAFLNKIKNNHIILMGDTNITEKETFIFETPDNYIDIYNEMELDSVSGAKYTYDYKSNKMVKGKYQSRMDRIYYRNSTKNNKWETISYSLVGRDNIESINKPPSDHFGVVIEMSI